MLRGEQLSILKDISQSIAFADERHGDLFELTPKGVTAIEDHAAALADARPLAHETAAAVTNAQQLRNRSHEPLKLRGIRA